MPKVNLLIDTKVLSLEEFKTTDAFDDCYYGENERGQYFRLPVAPNLAIPVYNGLSRKLEATGQHHVTPGLPASMWYWVREHYRMSKNKDQYGSVLVMLWNMQHIMIYMPRPHLPDRDKIEFFPDEASAVNERPIITSMAKFLRKTCPLYTDEYIRDVDAAYRASQSNELEILFGKELIRDAYLTGPHSCMAKSFHQHGGHPYYGHHPVDAYDAPGIGLAISRDAAKRINARSIVWINPDDNTDKRFVRVYGDSSLRARLMRNGYKLRGLGGAYLKANYSTDADTGANTFVAAYIDGPDGIHDAAEAVRYLLHFKETPDRLYLISETTSKTINQLCLKRDKPFGKVRAVTGTPSSEGVITFHSLSREDLVYTCPVTSKRFELLADMDNPYHSPIYVWFNGQIVYLKFVDEAIYTRFCASGTGWYGYPPDSLGRQMIYGDRQNPESKPPLFVHEGRTHIDDEHSRRSLGFRKLDIRYYPNEQQWVFIHPRRGVEGDGYTYAEDGQSLIRHADTVTLLYRGPDQSGDEYPPTFKEVHRAAIAGMEGLTKVHSMKRGRETYAAAGVRVVKTETGRKMVPQYHRVYQLWDETWTTHEVSFAHVWGLSVMCKEGVMPTVEIGNALWMKAVQHRIGSLESYTRNRSFRAEFEDVIWENICDQDNIYSVSPSAGISTRSRGQPIRAAVDVANINTYFARADATEENKRRLTQLVHMYRDVRNGLVAKYPTCAIIQTLTSLPGDPDTLPERVVEPATPLAELVDTMTGVPRGVISAAQSPAYTLAGNPGVVRMRQLHTQVHLPQPMANFIADGPTVAEVRNEALAAQAQIIQQIPASPHGWARIEAGPVVAVPIPDHYQPPAAVPIAGNYPEEDDEPHMEDEAIHDGNHQDNDQ